MLIGWKTEGRRGITAYRKGCASSPCVHVDINMACSLGDASELVRLIQKAIKYAKKEKK